MATRTPFFHSNGTYGYGGGSNGGTGGGMVSVPGGPEFAVNSQQGRQILAGEQQKATKFAAAQNAAEMAEIDQQEVEDRISENKSRNTGMTAVAFGNAQRGGQLGRGLFQRRQAGTKIGAALGSLASANSAALGKARRSTLKARQAADPARTNPALGYQAAMQGLYKQLA